jgi:membrane protein YdbS with pleckstrin-like domain
LESFTNTTIDTTQLPRFEEVQFSKLHPNYWKVILINTAITFFVFGIGVAFLFYFNGEISEARWYSVVAFVVLLAITVLLSRISFKKRGFAFREHDVLFQSGIIATKTIVIPYNRVQHVALHEGLVSRYFDLAKVEIFTAGGSSSDIEIPGIEKEQAENIKQLLMGKIQKQL